MLKLDNSILNKKLSNDCHIFVVSSNKKLYAIQTSKYKKLREQKKIMIFFGIFDKLYLSKK